MLKIGLAVTVVSILWAISALTVQFVLARKGRRKDYSVRAGNPGKAVLYNFTVAMMPAHKETVRNHPVKFLIGIAMHFGVFLTIMKLLVTLVLPNLTPIFPIITGPILLLTAMSGFILFVRRIFSANLRSMSNPEDYLSIVVTIGFICIAALSEFGIVNRFTFLVSASVFLFYLPIGKLKHALFFFIARADYGRRLGYRGTYPTTNGMKD